MEIIASALCYSLRRYSSGRFLACLEFMCVIHCLFPGVSLGSGVQTAPVLDSPLLCDLHTSGLA